MCEDTYWLCCVGAEMWVYLCANVSLQSKRYGWVSKVLCVHKVKLFKEQCRKGLDAVPPSLALELDHCEADCRKGETEACVVASETCWELGFLFLLDLVCCCPG